SSSRRWSAARAACSARRSRSKRPSDTAAIVTAKPAARAIRFMGRRLAPGPAGAYWTKVQFAALDRLPMLPRMATPAPVARGGRSAGGPPLKLQFKLHLLTPEDLHVVRRVGVFVVLAWVPLLVLCAVEGTLLGAQGRAAFLNDFAVHSRNL